MEVPDRPGLYNYRDCTEDDEKPEFDPGPDHAAATTLVLYCTPSHVHEARPALPDVPSQNSRAPDVPRLTLLASQRSLRPRT